VYNRVSIKSKQTSFSTELLVMGDHASTTCASSRYYDRWRNDFFNESYL